MLLKDIVNEESVQWFDLHIPSDDKEDDFFETNAKFKLKFLEPETLEKTRKKFTKKVFNKKVRTVIEETDEAEYARALIHLAVLDWHDFLLKDLVGLNYRINLTSEEQANTPIKFCKENLDDILDKSPSFVVFITNSISNFAEFAKKDREAWAKKSSSTQGASTKEQKA